jgi:hypothetical protein
MKRIYLILVFGLVFSAEKTIAQEQKRVVDNPEVQSLLALSETIQSGEIIVQVNKQRKGKSAVETEKYKMTFYKTGKSIDVPMADFHYNLLNLTDSIQYIYNGNVWYIIDHKKKICEIDTIWRKVSLVPLAYPILFLGEMSSFYANQFLEGTFLWATIIENIRKTENTTFLKVETNRISPDRKNDNKVLFSEEFEWDANKLLRHSVSVKDDAGYSRKTVVKTETLLTNASLNDKKHANVELYNGLNYAKLYKIKYSK